jgi:hypothetical protein
MWNSLNDTIRNVDSISKFKSELKKIDETENHAVPKHDLYHIFIVEEIKESLVEDSLQKGKIISFPFLKGYTDVLCIVGAVNNQNSNQN